MGFPHRTRPALAALAAAALLVTGTLAGAAAAHAAPPTAPSQVTSMAALGDSITLATSSCSSWSGCAANSWSTGSSTTVSSHFLRLRAIGATALTRSNFAVSGAKAEALNAQAVRAVGVSADYVTIEIGANDACTRTVAQMTPTAAFQSSVRAALDTLRADPPQIFVASIPNLQRLHEINRSSASARLTWALFGICQSMLANPSSTLPADVQRRAAVQQRVNEYNAILRDECAAVIGCRFDGGALATHPFTRADISTRDYFHPSLTGQATIAQLTWPMTQWAAP